MTEIKECYQTDCIYHKGKKECELEYVSISWNGCCVNEAKD